MGRFQTGFPSTPNILIGRGDFFIFTCEKSRCVIFPPCSGKAKKKTRGNFSVQATNDTRSIWQKEARMPNYKRLEKDIRVKNLIIGGGLCGLLTAYQLQQKGETDIAVIEAEEFMSGMSSRTTAKITSQHGAVYASLLSLGKEKAQQYAEANEAAIAMYEQIVEREKIDCDFTRCDSFLYTVTPKEVKTIQKEAEAAALLNIPASFEITTELPFPVCGALRFPCQARFQPVLFAKRICELLEERGARLYSHSKAISVEDGRVRTEEACIMAYRTFLCTRYPLEDKKGWYFAKMYQQRFYLLALENAPAIQNMYLEVGGAGLSLRPYRSDLLLGGFNHKTGHEENTRHLDNLRQKAKELFPESREAAGWSSQDSMTHDSIPYIGREERMGDRVFIAAGFNEWGMTTSMAAADILSSLALEKETPNAPVFSPKRVDPALQAKSFTVHVANMAYNLIAKAVPYGRVGSLEPGEGKIAEVGGKRTGICRREDGSIVAIEARCTHMGCPLQWNPDEKTWDCTCHGSRFSPEGNVICGPAQEPLKGVELPHE